MPLTAAQKTTLGTNISANNTVLPASATLPNGQTVTFQFSGTAISAVTHNTDGSIDVANWYNLQASPDFTVWRDIPMETVLGLITYASMTPADAVPTTPDLDVQIWKARSLACQGKQFNLQNLTIGRTTAPMKRTNYRAAMQDCLTNLPAGAAGALISANWTGVRDAAKFLATNAEKLFATGTGSTGSPGDLAFEGTVSSSEIRSIWGV